MNWLHTELQRLSLAQNLKRVFINLAQFKTPFKTQPMKRTGLPIDSGHPRSIDRVVFAIRAN